MFQVFAGKVTVKVAETLEEACKLLEVGFEYALNITENMFMALKSF